MSLLVYLKQNFSDYTCIFEVRKANGTNKAGGYSTTKPEVENTNGGFQNRAKWNHFQIGSYYMR